MLFQITSTFWARASETGQSKAEYVLILAPLSAMLALVVSTLVLSSN